MHAHFLVTVVPSHGPAKQRKFRDGGEAQAFYDQMELTLGAEVLGVSLKRVDARGHQQNIRYMVDAPPEMQDGVLQRL